MKYWTYEDLSSGIAVPEGILGIAGRTLRSFEPYVAEPVPSQSPSSLVPFPERRR